MCSHLGIKHFKARNELKHFKAVKFLWGEGRPGSTNSPLDKTLAARIRAKTLQIHPGGVLRWLYTLYKGPFHSITNSYTGSNHTKNWKMARIILWCSGIIKVSKRAISRTVVHQEMQVFIVLQTTSCHFLVTCPFGGCFMPFQSHKKPKK